MENKYSKYYDALNGSGVDSKASSLVSNSDSLTSATTKLSSQISSSTWQELGLEEIKNTYIPAFTECTNTLKSNLGVLQNAATTSMGLVPKIESLESLINSYNSCQEEQYSEKSNYLNQINQAESDIEQVIKSIKAMNSNIADLPEVEVSLASDGTNVDVSSLSGMVPYNYNGVTYYVTNTKLSLGEYLKVIDRNGIAQQYGDYGGKCLSFSYTHVGDLIKGTTNHNGKWGSEYHIAYDINEIQTWDHDQALKIITSEVSKGKPVIVQVNGNKNGTSRHFVTVVGVKESAVKSGKVQESDLLVLDSYDGDLRTLDRSQKKNRFMTQGKDTGNGNYGYYLITIKDQDVKTVSV